ncbi:MAG TPA: hypothetical protein VFB96_16485 [Pirellulaceae bacterium]|nr:hypothetical protein [Pirellulaceae bacterium]
MAAAPSAANVKLGKQLGAIRRELVANPKKTAVLLVLLAAAAWFWGPILWRRFGGGSTAAPATAQNAASSGKQSAVILENRLVGVVPTVGKSGKPLADWRQLLAARRRDPLAQPAAFDPQWPQPFKAPDLATSLAGGTDPGGQPALPFSPAEVGLVLESIVYGKSNKMAVINGEVYREGSEVAVATAQGPPVSFQLLRIERNRVAMKRHDREYWLEFPRPKLTGSDRIEASHSTPAPPQQDQP